MDPTTFATAYGLSTSIGIRPFLTLALASVAMHFGYLHPSASFAFLGSNGATLLLAALAVLEFAGDKLPVVDHALHVLHFATKPVAAALLVGGTFGSAGTPDGASYALMGAAALNALGIHTGIATLRGASTATTLGFGNPFLSLCEDIAAVTSTILAILLPFAGAALALAATIVVLVAARYVIVAVRRSRASSAPA